MNYQELMKNINTEIQRLNWSQEELRSHLKATYGEGSIGMLINDHLVDFLNYLRRLSLQVIIPAGLFDQIERYLERQAAEADAEASRLLMALEDLEIERVAQEELTKKSEAN